jgi:hypothetical protein
MSKLRFTAKMEIREGNPYVLVSADRVAKIKKEWRKPLPVLIQINGEPKKPWSINMMPVGDGSFYLYLHGDVRKASQTKVGDAVTVDIEFDGKYKNGPMHPMPKWFEEALDKHPIAKENWQKLIPSRQKEILRYFSWLKSPEAQQRNLEKALHALSGKPERFMARSWKDGK